MSAPSNPSIIKIVVPSTALQQVCNYVAISETKSPAESLRELILHTLFTFEEDKASNVNEDGTAITSTTRLKLYILFYSNDLY